jgi:UDP-N-acetylglucosamine 3-dehydrogenase
LSGGNLRVAVVGLGFGANHARVLSEIDGVELAAVCDRDPGRLAALNAAPAKSYADLQAMLAVEKLDAIVVAVPAAMHETVTLAALSAGIAVLVEKPLAPSLSAGRRLVTAAARADIALMAGHIERFNPALSELAQRVRAGDAGRVLQVAARRTGAIRTPPADVNVIHDSALHDIDAMRFVLGAEVAEVQAQAISGVVAAVENSLLATMRFRPIGGLAAMASLEVNWLSPRRLRDLTVLGEKGLFVLDYAAQTLDFYETPPDRTGPVQGWQASRQAAGPGPVRIAVEPREQLVQELLAFVAALRDGCPMPVTGEDALAALAVADALTESARNGRSVRPEQVRQA